MSVEFENTLGSEIEPSWMNGLKLSMLNSINGFSTSLTAVTVSSLDTLNRFGVELCVEICPTVPLF